MSNRGESWFMTTGMRVWTLRIPAVLAVASIALAGCSTPEDLFACNLPLSCPEMSVDSAGPEEEECARSTVASGKPNVLLATADPGPWLDEWQFLLILRGDGTAVLQIRERHCDGDWTARSGAPCPTDMTEQYQCNVVFPSSNTTCELDGDTSGLCDWWLWSFKLADCTPIDTELLCSDAKAILMQ